MDLTNYILLIEIAIDVNLIFPCLWVISTMMKTWNSLELKDRNLN